MTPELIAAAVSLAETLAAENAALTALDLPRAVSLIPEKQRASDAFAAAQALARRGTEPHAEAARLAARLHDLAAENRRLLERAINVQSRVLGLVARAVPRATAHRNGTRYGANGNLSASRQAMAFALSARA
jgi:hypothetical protein